MLGKEEAMKGRGKAFTLVELLVVMAILAVLASIAFRFGDRLGEGERVVQCQAQLKAIYQAIKMYKLDTGGVPPFFTRDWRGPDDEVYKGYLDLPPTERWKYGLGLLYQMGYLDNKKVFKCPDHDIDPRGFPSIEDYWAAMNGYQDPRDENGQFPSPTDINQWPYLPDLGITDPNDPNFYRQLQPKKVDPRRWWPADDTVVTWCRFHRGLYRKGGHDLDLVLFWDGSVEAVPAPANHFVKPPAGGAGP